MRPLELTLEAFKSYLEEETFTFEGRTLFAIVGPTGAGKSTILEAMMYALYGRTHKESRRTTDLIRMGADSAKVRLSFLVDSGAWEVKRRLNRGQGSTAVLTRLADPHPVETGQTAVTERIEELVGLDFEAFCSSVILPQGKFDKFLMATPSARSEILKGIFKLDRVDAMQARARQRRDALNEEKAGLVGEARALPADPVRLEVLRVELAQTQIRADSIRQELAQVTAAERTVEQLEARLGELRTSLALIDRAVSRVPGPAELRAIAADESATLAAFESSRTKVAAAQQEYEAAAAELDRVKDDKGLLGQAGELEASRRRLGDAVAAYEAKLSTLGPRVERAGQIVVEIAAQYQSAELASGEAQARVKDLERRHAAHVLRSDLHAGDTCPVCEQPVEEVPDHPVPDALEAAQLACAQAGAAAEKAGSHLRQAEQDQALAERLKKDAAERLEEKRSELLAALERLHRVLGIVEDPAAEIARRLALLDAAASRADESRRKVGRLAELAAQAGQEVEQAARKRRRVAAGLAELSTTLGFTAPDVESDMPQLQQAGAAASQAGESRRSDIAQLQAGLIEESDHAMGILASFRTRFGLQPEARAGEALEQAMARKGTLTSEIRTIEEALIRASEIERSIRRTTDEAALYERLVGDLTNHKLTAYLLDADRRLLSLLGSEKLFELTGGRYRFDDEGRFEIIEIRSDGQRSAGTLSGGETFLASLALALGLAEAVSQTGGRLGCFFLDEGFGSLDMESLSLALRGIETLADSGKLIGLISHVGGIQADLDDLIVLDKGDDGRTVVLQTEGPIAYSGVLV